MNYSRAGLILAALLPASVGIASDAFPPPPDATVEMIAPTVTSRGVTMSIRRIETDAGIETVLAFYRELWGDAANETHLPPWRMIGRIDEDRYHNVQLQTRGDTTWGYLSTSDLPGQVRRNQSAATSSTRKFPMMNGTTVIDDQLHDDPGKQGRVIVMVNDFSVKSNHAFYRRHFITKGWRILMDEQTASRGRAFALHASQGAKTVSMTIAEQDGLTAIVANEVKRGLLE